MTRPQTPIKVTGFGILTIPGKLTPDQARTLAHKFNEARRTNKVLIADDGAKFTPLKPPRKRIRLAQAERGHA